MNRTLKKIILFISISPFVAITAIAQKAQKKVSQEINIPMEPAYWQFDTAGVNFIMSGNVKAAYLKGPSQFALKDVQFSNGTIEYDAKLGGGFPGIHFRMSDDRKNGESFYLRYFGITSREYRTALQYTTVIDNVSIWDLTDEYQAGVAFNIPGWNHVKLVVSGKQMKAYINDMSRPALIVPYLEGRTEKGGIFFWGGEVTIANLVIKPDVVENLSPLPGYVSSYNDPRYLRNWQVSPASDFAPGKEVIVNLPTMDGNPVKAELPDSTTQWKPLAAEERAIVNLTRLYGMGTTKRRLAWLKTTIESDKDQERILHLGFSDEIWLFINGGILYSDKNNFTSPGLKFPKGRCTIENATVRLPLKKGKNEILIGLTNYFYGWGIIARLDDTDGIHLPGRVN